MDMFTDVDIFSDLLEAAGRHVPVYILLDERNAPHFVNMVMSCKVNLDLIQVSFRFSYIPCVYSNFFLFTLYKILHMVCTNR